MWTRVNIRTCVSSALSKLKTPELKITSPSKKWKLLEKTAIFGEESLTGCCWRKDFGQAQRLRKPRFLANWSKKLHSTLGPRPRAGEKTLGARAPRAEITISVRQVSPPFFILLKYFFKNTPMHFYPLPSQEPASSLLLLSGLSTSHH